MTRRDDSGFRTPTELTEGVFRAFFVILGFLFVVLAFCGLWALTSSPTLTSDADTPTYDYAGPDGTLTGVPYQLHNYVVVDHDTGVYYFLIYNPETGAVALCPRYELDGTLWKMPTYEERGV